MSHDSRGGNGDFFEVAVIGVIAHEFGHLFLQHLDDEYSEEELGKIENAVDDKAIEWGFKREILAMRQAQA